MKHFTSDIVIGLEIHSELDTKTKLFCPCPTHGSEEPNTRTCPTCLGMPGSKPVLNKKAVEFALKLCLALNCKISPELIFSRKSYFYPDMAKNFQISQYEIPLGKEGKLNLSNGKEIGITRVHMEEDPASLVHPSGMQKSAYVLVDYNRSGNPLLEIVTKPELSSAAEARDFMKQLINVLNYLEIFDENYNIIKADANISIRESGFVKAEVKNITGFKEIEKALNYETQKHKISKEDAIVLAQEKLLADLFEKVAEEIDAALAAKWLRRELVRVLNYNKKELHQLEIDESHLIDLLRLVENKKITDNVASKILEKLIEKPFDVKEFVKKEKLEAVSDTKEIEKYCIEAIKENPQAVKDYKKGEKKALNFIVGKVMQKTRGKATPREVNEIILRLIR